jgi:HK97 family phage prohead protease
MISTPKIASGSRSVPNNSSGDESRSFKGAIRSTGEGRKVIGYPIIFNELSQGLGVRERILPDAVTFDDDVRADFNHNPDRILGRRAAGTLKLSIDAKGVRMEATPPDATWADDLLVSIRRGDIDQGSFAFCVLPGGQTFTEENGEQVRNLTKILVHRVSVVSDPAYTKTSIEVRNGAGRGVAPPAPRAQTAPMELLRRKQSLIELA